MMISQGGYTSVLSPAMMPNMFVLEIVPRLLQEQARTISKITTNRIGFMVFGLKVYQQEDKTSAS